MITMKELGAPIRQWVPDWLGLICIFIVILPVTMLNGSYTGSMLEVSNTLGTNTEDITMGSIQEFKIHELKSQEEKD